MKRRYNAPGHLLTIPTAHTGKGRDVLIPALLDEPHTVSLSASDFSFADVKKRGVTTYVVVPTDYHDVCDKYFRLLVSSCEKQKRVKKVGPM
jgi:hypothetical protein